MTEAEALTRKGKDKTETRTRGRWRMWLRRLALLVLAVLALPYLLMPLYAVVNPPVTFVMLQKTVTMRLGIHKQWRAFDDISPRLVRAVLASEDARFCSHHGIDWVEVRNVLNDDEGAPRGASTITMQMARNLFYPAGRSYIRKAQELPLALYAELVMSKRRILEIYLNVAEFGPGVYGAEAAAQRSFGVPASKLTARQAALLAAVLPAPGLRDPAKPSAVMSRIARRIAGRAARIGAADDCVL